MTATTGHCVTAVNTKNRRAVSGHRHGRARGEPLSEQPPVPAETRAERALVRLCGALAVAGWFAGLGVIVARFLHDLPIGERTYSVLASWTIAAAALGLGVVFLRDDDPHTVDMYSRLDYGNPVLDDVLCNSRPPWRSRPVVRAGFGVIATASWLLAVPYSVQLVLGVYRAAPMTELSLLMWLLAAAVCSSVIVATAPPECRRAAAQLLACEAHREQREKRGRLGRAAADDIGATGEIPRVRQGDVIDLTERSRSGRYGASG